MKKERKRGEGGGRKGAHGHNGTGGVGPVRGESEGRETKRQVGRGTGTGREQQGRDTIRHEGGVP